MTFRLSAAPAWLRALPYCLLGGAISVAQQTTPADRTAGSTEDETDQEVVRLSPFLVETSRDRGYAATNAISGTRLNTPIRDLPMSLEVVTNEFMRDTGVTNLREALRYSAGVVIESQYDGLKSTGSIDGPGSAGANDPRGTTRNPHGSTVKIRGFVTEQTLREGFRRQQSTDWINLDRVEVLRGPSALLYGVGNLGGIVNYVIKRPLANPRYWGQVAFGSNDFYRAEFDVSQPFDRNSPLNRGWRVTGAWQDSGDFTDLYNRESWFVSPVLVWELPNERTTLTLDLEAGRIKETGIGFQSVRAWLNEGGTASGQQLRRNGFITPGAGGPNERDPRTFRWSGPDTYRENPAYNVLLDAQHQLFDRTWIRAGLQYSENEFNGINVSNAQLRVVDSTRWSYGFYRTPRNAAEQAHIDAIKALNPSGGNMNLPNPANEPQRYQQMVDLFNNRPPNFWYGDIFNAGPVRGFSPLPNSSEGNINTTYDYVLLAYQWQALDSRNKTTQGRVELTHEFDFIGRNNLLFGVQTRDEDRRRIAAGQFTRTVDSTITPNNWNFTSTQNPQPIRRDVQGDGVTPSIPIAPISSAATKANDRGAYLVLQSRLFNDRLTVILGGRFDTAKQTDTTTDFLQPGNPVTVSGGDPYEEFSPQIGFSFQVTRNVSLFGLYSTGILPNYGLLDGSGKPFTPTKAKNLEGGLKFDFFEGRVSGTFSGFKIERTNIARDIWWAPSPGIPAARKGAIQLYDPNKRNALSNSGYDPYIAFLMRNDPGFAKVDPAAAAFMAGIPSDPRDPTKPYGFADKRGAQINPYDWVVDPATGDTVEAGLLWMQYGTWSQQNYNDRWRWWDTWGSAARFQLIPIDQNTPEGLAGQQFIRQGMLMMAKGEIGWFNWVYARNGQAGKFGDGTEGIVNSFAAEYSAPVPFEDQSQGYEMQIILSPLPEMQIVLGYSYLENEVTSKKYNYAPIGTSDYQAEFGIWNFPAETWGSFGLPANQAFADPTDTTTSLIRPIESGGPLDDTPQKTFTFWMRYGLDRIPALRGFAFGFGGNFESERLYLAGVTPDGTGIGRRDADGRFVIDRLYTKPRWRYNAMIEYNRRWGDRYDTRFAINIENIQNDKDLYGFVYAPGRSMRASFSLGF